MEQNLKAVTFEYMDEGEWRNYFTQIQNFVEKAKSLREFHRELVRRCDGMPFNELQNQLDYSQVLLGGVNENGEYRERSLAKLYKEILGLQFDNLKEVIEKRRQDITPSTTIVVKKTPFIDEFLSPALDKAETTLQLAHENNLFHEPDIDSEYDFQGLVSDQDDFSQLMADVVNRLQEFLPNYNEKALFVWTLNKTPHRYLSTAYPRLTNKESWQWLNNVFGLEPVFTPTINETGSTVEEQKQQYTVYAYRDGSIGDTLTRLYRLVWNTFDGPVCDSLKLLFPDIPNFKQEFLDEAHDELDRIGAETPQRTKIKLSGESETLKVVGSDEKYSADRGDTTQAEYHISEVTIDSYDYAGYSTSGNYNTDSDECELSLLQVLDDLAPGLFLLNGLEYELDIDQHSLEVEKL